MQPDTCIDDMANALLDHPYNEVLVEKGSVLEKRIQELAAERAEKKAAPAMWAKMFKDTKLKQVTKEIEVVAAQLRLQFDCESAYASLRIRELDSVLRAALQAAKEAPDVGEVQRVMDDVRSKAAALATKKWWLKRGAFDLLEEGTQEEDDQMRAGIDRPMKKKNK
jgi:hypothetical protein